METHEPKPLSRIGFEGNLRDKVTDFVVSQPGMFKARLYGQRVISTEESLQLYEDSYYGFLRDSPDVLDWLVKTASDVYDNSPTNVHSGLDYSVQEAPSRHLQDIAVRRSLDRLGKSFKGDHLVEIRGKDSEGYVLNPGRVPFVDPDRILSPRREGWWKPGSVEDFWQSCKMLYLDGSLFYSYFQDDAVFPPDGQYVIDSKRLDFLSLEFASFQSDAPTVFGRAAVDNKEYFLKFEFPYKEGEFLSCAQYYGLLRNHSDQMDLLFRVGDQLPKGSMKKLRRFTEELEYIS